jgi:ribosome-associated translation inhibitor RaiA
MNIQFRQGSGDIPDRVLERAQAKLRKLTRFILELNYEAQVYVDVDRESGSNNSDDLWRASVNMDLAGERFNATQTGSTPEKAIDLSIKELKRVLRRSKQKTESLRRQGGSLLKRLLHRPG